MTLLLLLERFWALNAYIFSMTPRNFFHWDNICILIGLGIVKHGFLAWKNMPWICVIVIVPVGQVLPWPVVYLNRWVKLKGNSI